MIVKLEQRHLFYNSYGRDCFNFHFKQESVKFFCKLYEGAKLMAGLFTFNTCFQLSYSLIILPAMKETLNCEQVGPILLQIKEK